MGTVHESLKRNDLQQSRIYINLYMHNNAKLINYILDS